MWLGDMILRDRFWRFFDLADNLWVTVVDMFILGMGEGGESWRLRLRLLAWEEKLVGECRDLLHNVTLQVDTEDHWLWISELAEGYTVCGD
jgi:hypothetical protein